MWRDPIEQQHRTTEHRYLEQMRIGIREALGPYCANHLQMRDHYEQMQRELLTYVLADRHDSHQARRQTSRVYECPRFATWWDHFKSVYQGRWWMSWRRWTVRYAEHRHVFRADLEIDFTPYMSFPYAADYPAWLGEGRPIVIVDSARTTSHLS